MRTSTSSTLVRPVSGSWTTSAILRDIDGWGERDWALCGGSSSPPRKRGAASVLEVSNERRSYLTD
jgi:hypothetical protein